MPGVLRVPMIFQAYALFRHDFWGRNYELFFPVFTNLVAPTVAVDKGRRTADPLNDHVFAG